MSERSTIYRFVSNAYQMIVAMGMLAATSCGGSPGPTTTSTTTTTASATTTTTAATTSTTTTAPVTTTTTSTTTTSIPVLTGSISVQNTPCTAPSTGQVSCTFVGNASGGQAPFTFSWRFTANNQVVIAPGQQVRPEIGCGFSMTGVASFNLAIALTITAANNASTTVNGTQQIIRAAGNCGV
jgi:hypothetical protein